MTARNSGIGNGEEFLRPEVGQRPPKRESTFGQRKPLERKTPLKSKWKPRPRMSADAQVQEAMLGKGRCWIADAFDTDCDGRTDPAHIVPQRLIKDVFPYGAKCGFVWRPVREDEPQEAVGASLFRPLQELLDDNTNIIPVCRSHHGFVDATPAEMVKALGMVGTPEGFGEFCDSYGFTFTGRYWIREPHNKPVVRDPRLDSGEAA